MAASRSLLLLHFNDVYNIESATSEPVGGAARLATLIRRYHEENPLVLFSGDCLSPSLMSTMTRGKQMVPILNAMGIQAACLGNHDLDFGIDYFASLLKEWNFVWLVANAFDKHTGLLLGGLQGTRVMEWDGVKIGVMGLVEEEWLKTLATLEPDDIIYIDFVECAQKCCTELKAQGVALIVALTHMRQLNDALLLNAVPEIDLILGGHDHFYHAERHPDHGNLLIKSGTDFRDLTKIRIELNADGTKNYEWEHLFVTSAIEEDPIVKEIIAEFVDVSSHSLSDVIGHSVSELDGRFDAIRSRETNLGNFICDVIREAARSDICFINSGTFRSNRLHAPGPITKRDLLDILPMIDETVVLRLKGSTILEALENSVALYPKHEGRFLQVSGLRFVFDPSQPSHHRILNTSVYLTDSGSPLDPEQDYRVCTKAYLFLGKDGYDMLRDQHVLQDSETAPVLPLYIRWHFMKLDVLTSWKQEVAGVKEGIKRFAHRWRRILADPSDQENPNRSWTALFDQDRLSYVIAPCLENRIVSLHNA